MQYQLQLFEDENENQFRVIDREGEPWFILSEVCNHLEIANHRDAAGRLDDDEKDAVGITDANGRPRITTIINESGLYNLILGSRKPAAKKFRKWITSEVLPAIRTTGGYGSRVPAFIQRYNDNWDRVDTGYFSVISELTVRLYGRLENVGHLMADKTDDGKELRPDVSVGRCFAKWFSENHPEHADDFKTYIHKTPETEIEARQYPLKYLPAFIEYVDEVWIPERAEQYFKKRDPKALPYLPKLLPKPKNSAA